MLFRSRASVVLQLKPNSDIGKRRVEAVRQLVASAVKNLSPARVSIVDTQGNLLARGDGEASLGASSTLVEQKLDQERRLRMGIERLVEQYVGIGKVRADENAGDFLKPRPKAASHGDAAITATASQRTAVMSAAVHADMFLRGCHQADTAQVENFIGQMPEALRPEARERIGAARDAGGVQRSGARARRS